MVTSISIIAETHRRPVDLPVGFSGELPISCDGLPKGNTASFDIEIVFSDRITHFRNHDYSWTGLSENRVANSFSPKIVRLSNGFYVQANSNRGIWEVQKSDPSKLLWRFHPQDSEPLARYSGSNNQKSIAVANPGFEDYIEPALLFSQTGAVELSRSKMPFVATACFTDHCDFDTPENLRKQREFFKTHQIRVTKGFFLNHFSKRPGNASWENDADELLRWQADGHELCYHSLSQSIKSNEESSRDFYAFSPPASVATWIDHGYQPYNLSLYRKEGYDETAFAQNLSRKGIGILWNYIDSGTATSGVLNQLDPQNFTLAAFYEGIKSQPLKKRLSLLIKNAIVHFYADERLIKKYARLASGFKKKNLPEVAGSGFGLAFPLLKLLLSWRRLKKKPYPLARYQNLFFEHAIASERFVIFQTLELLDFAKAFDQESIDGLVSEKGLFVGHTYFSVPMAYHDGKIFDQSGAVNPKVAANFEYLGREIGRQKIWNPTLRELAAHWTEFNKVAFTLSESGQIIIKGETQIPYRTVT